MQPPQLHDSPSKGGWLEFRRRIERWMDVDRATTVRDFRVKEQYTWRGVAGECSELWGTDWGENQIVGMFLCEVAASLLGEDAASPPWN